MYFIHEHGSKVMLKALFHDTTELKNRLQYYELYGVPEDTFVFINYENLPNFKLPELSWKQLNSFSLENAEKCLLQQQEVLWEFYMTEKSYLDTLCFLVENFLLPLNDLLYRNVYGPVIDAEQVLGNIHDICILHCHLWQDKIESILENAREKDTNEYPLTATDLTTVFELNGEFLENLIPHYQKYLIHHSEYSKNIEYLVKEIPTFQTLVNWVEKKSENKLKLSDMIATPFQRIMKYELLLKAVLKTQASDELLAIQNKLNCKCNELNSEIGKYQDAKKLENIEEFLYIQNPVPDFLSGQKESFSIKSRTLQKVYKEVRFKEICCHFYGPYLADMLTFFVFNCLNLYLNLFQNTKVQA